MSKLVILNTKSLIKKTYRVKKKSITFPPEIKFMLLNCIIGTLRISEKHVIPGMGRKGGGGKSTLYSI